MNRHSAEMSKITPVCPKQFTNIQIVGMDIGKKNLPVVMNNFYGDVKTGTSEFL